MSVDILPAELTFQRPFTSEVSRVLKISNPGRTPVAFKVKTTAPKQYCVRPNSGRIEPGKDVEVSVLLQAMKQEPPPDAKCRDKFLVQSVAVTADKEFTNISAIWQHVDEAEKSSVQEKKIRVSYIAAKAPSAAEAVSTPLRNGANGSSDSHETAPPPYNTSSNRSPSPEETFTPETRRTTLAPQSAVKQEDTGYHADAQSTSSTTSATTAAVIPMSYEELKAKYAEAQATIASYGQEAGLRMRKVAKGETSNETVNQLAQQIQQQGAQGVPLQIVAALCLLSFLIAYFFF